MQATDDPTDGAGRAPRGPRLGSRGIALGADELPLLSGALHYFHVPRAAWGRCLDAALELGLPIVESYVTSGRHGPTMRRAIGGFNLVWMSAAAASLVLMGPLLETGNSRLAMVAYGPIALLSMLPLLVCPRRPAPHDVEAGEVHVPASYPALLRASRVLLPVSYLFLGALGPLMPYLVEGVGVVKTAQKLLGGLDVPSDGTITVAGDEITSLSRRKLTAWRARHVASSSRPTT